MRATSRWMAAGVTLLALAAGALLLSGTGRAADEEPLQKQLLALADSIAANKESDVKKQAAAIAEQFEGVEELMHLMSARRRNDRGGLGVGDKPGAITPDGIEAKITQLANKEISLKQLAKEAKAIERMAHITAAIAAVTEIHTPKGIPKEKKQIWLEAAEGTRKSALEMARAAKKQEASAIRTAALHLNTNCTKCHELFLPTVAELIANLKNRSELVRVSASVQLAQLGKAKKLKDADAKLAVAAMIEALKDQSTRSRSVYGDYSDLLDHLRIKNRTPIVPVNEAMTDASDHVRLWFCCKFAQADPAPKKAVPLLAEVLKQSDAMIRCTAANALGRIGKEAEGAIPALETVLDDKDASVRQAAALALQKIGSKQAVPTLIRALKDEDLLISIQAAHTLGRMGAAAVPALTEALKDPERRVRASAASALGRIGADAKPAVPALREMLKGKDEYLRKVAGDALKKIETRGK